MYDYLVKLMERPRHLVIELETTSIVATLTLSNDDEITSGRFIRQGADGLHLLKILFEIFQNSREPNLLF